MIRVATAIASAPTRSDTLTGQVDHTLQIFDSLVLLHAALPALRATTNGDPKTEHLYLSGGGMLFGHVHYDEMETLPQAAGYYPYQSWHASRLRGPSFARAALIVEDAELQPGASIRLKGHGGRWPVEADAESGWVCLRDAGANAGGVEFAPSCVATLVDGELLAAPDFRIRG